MSCQIIYYILAFVLFTQMRGALLLIMPAVPFILNKLVPFTISKEILKVLCVIILLSTVSSILFAWSPLENVLLFYWLFIPLLVLFYAKPQKGTSIINVHDFFKYTFRVLFVVDLIGLLVWLKVGGDEFGTAYGRHYEYVHGLAFINLFYFLYYFYKLKQHFQFNKDSYKTVFLFISFVLCDFGLAWVTLFLTILGLLMLRMRLKNLVIIFLSLILGFALLQSDRFSYERRNIEMVFEQSDRVRKVVMFKDLPRFFAENPILPVLGSGPGSYNSRVAVLLSGDNQNIFTNVLGIHHPPFYTKYIYPLWNNKIVSQDSYTDGTRNKPYSSFVSLFTELGFFFLFIIVFSFISRILFFDKEQSKHWICGYLKVVYMFMFISLFIHDWIISTEFVVFLLINLLCIKTINSK